MNWYNQARLHLAMPLDPNAWQYDDQPARLRQHMPFDYAPAAKARIPQPQDPKVLEKNYFGVHLTPSIEMAAIYANNKASAKDPPVVIELDPTEMPQELDVDAKVEFTIDGYLSGVKSTWQQILTANLPAEKKADQILQGIEEDSERWEFQSNWDDQPADLIAQTAQGIPPTVLSNYLGNKSADQILSIIQQMVNGFVPKEITIGVLQQFRVMHPIPAERVRAIYQIPWYDMNTMMEGELDDEELKEKGYRVKGDNVYTQQGALVGSHDTFNYGWYLKDKTTLYVNRQLPLLPEEIESIWHGTTLSRARQAFPELFQRRRKRQHG